MQPPFNCDYGSNIQLGKKCFFNFNCVLLDGCEVLIGNHVLFGLAVQVSTATHAVDAPLWRSHEFGEAISIGDNV